MDLRGLLKAFLILFAALSVGDALAQSDELGALNARIEASTRRANSVKRCRLPNGQ